MTRTATTSARGTGYVIYRTSGAQGAFYQVFRAGRIGANDQPRYVSASLLLALDYCQSNRIRPVGRPRTERGEDSKRVTVRLSDSEARNLTRYARKLDLTPAECIRVTLAAAGVTVALKQC
jgi:hypothetical protein